MKTRVTVTLDPDLHRLAKQAARKKHTTVAGLIDSPLQAEVAPAEFLEKLKWVWSPLSQQFAINP